MEDLTTSSFDYFLVFYLCNRLVGTFPLPLPCGFLSSRLSDDTVDHRVPVETPAILLYMIGGRVRRGGLASILWDIWTREAQ